MAKTTRTPVEYVEAFRNRKLRSLTEMQKADIRLLHDKGVNLEQLKEKLGVSRYLLNKALKEVPADGWRLRSSSACRQLVDSGAMWQVLRVGRKPRPVANANSYRRARGGKSSANTDQTTHSPSLLSSIPRTSAAASPTWDEVEAADSKEVVALLLNSDSLADGAGDQHRGLEGQEAGLHGADSEVQYCDDELALYTRLGQMIPSLQAFATPLREYGISTVRQLKETATWCEDDIHTLATEVGMGSLQETAFRAFTTQLQKDGDISINVFRVLGHGAWGTEPLSDWIQEGDYAQSEVLIERLSRQGISKHCELAEMGLMGEQALLRALSALCPGGAHRYMVHDVVVRVMRDVREMQAKWNALSDDDRQRALL